MRTFGILALFAVFGIQGALADTASMRAARDVKEQIQSLLFSMKGVNGVGITGCDSNGKQVVGGSEDCISIGTETAAAASALRTLLPSGTRVDGVFVVVKKIGTIRPQPRASAGNRE
jgi:hypothetical protein